MASRSPSMRSMDGADSASRSSVDMQVKTVTPSPDNGGYFVELEVAPRIEAMKKQNQTPLDLVCVVDESYSMSDAATLTGSESNEDGRLNIMDIVRHAVKTIIQVLGPDDRLSIVGFSREARVVCELTPMNKKGKAQTTKGADSLKPTTNTNLWAGLKSGLDVLRDASSESPTPVNKRGIPSKRRQQHFVQKRLKSIMLLTDGVPNYNPKEGIASELDAYLNRFPDFERSVSIHSFGFGYSLDSVLLQRIAIRGGGTYSFIPDAGMVGTIFINALANAKTTIATGIQLHLAYGGTVCQWIGYGARFDDASAIGRSVDNHDVVFAGCLQLEQPRSFIVKVNAASGSSALQFKLTFHNFEIGELESVSRPVDLSKECISSHFREQYARAAFVDTILDAACKMTLGPTGATKVITNFIQTVNSSEDTTSATPALIEGILADAHGQVTQALSRVSWFKKWGRHYLPSLAEAHLQQQCNNFKDPGVQGYGGELFETARDHADDVFLALPPPTPSDNGKSNCSSSSSSHGAGISMANYHSADNGCFDGNCLIVMANGSEKRVDSIRAGQQVATPHGFATVRCVVKNLCSNGQKPMVRLGSGLLVTPYHPVRSSCDAQWVFPKSLGKVELVDCEAVYTFVLDEGHVVCINDTLCVTLGHGFTDNAVVRHRFFGTDRVVHALQALPGWDSGLVTLQPNSFLKSSATGVVVGIVSQDISTCKKLLAFGQTQTALVHVC